MCKISIAKRAGKEPKNLERGVKNGIVTVISKTSRVRPAAVKFAVKKACGEFASAIGGSDIPLIMPIEK